MLVRGTILILAAALVAPIAQAQGSQSSATPPPPVVADVHTSQPSLDRNYFRYSPPAGGRYTLRQATLLDLIVEAYGFERGSVLGGPAWLDFNRYDLTLQVPPNATRETAKLALRVVLTNRFGLVFHADIQPLPAILLTLGSGALKLKQSADVSGDSGACQYFPPASPPQQGSRVNTVSFSCHGMTMEKYAQTLRGQSGDPIVDSTGLKGTWDFDISYDIVSGRGIDKSGVVEKLGLKLEPGMAPQPVVVVDSVNEKPTPNPPDLSKILPPPPPAAFDFAVIKPSAPGVLLGGIGFNGPNRVTLKGQTLQDLIARAFDINDAMIDGPAFISKQRWDITAKAPEDNPTQGPGPQQQNVEVLRAMLRTLLADRFLMKSHIDQRPADAYTLLAGNPKMKKADPTSRTFCRSGPGPDGKDPRATNPILSFLVTCQNITMTQFALSLRNAAVGYIKTPVLNSTNLDGAYDFTLSFSDARAARQASASSATSPAAGDGAVTSTDVLAPSGAISLPEAISKTLGLKLVLQKRPVPMVVIDHLEEIPTEN